MIISFALKSAATQLEQSSDTPRLDAELLLANVLNKPRSYLIAYNQQELTAGQQQRFQALIEKRSTKYPMAYLLGEKEFWSMNFLITEDVLIPRPETELLIELILKQFQGWQELTLVDLGTGSGAIALAIAKEKPSWTIIATDQSEKALSIAQKNAQQLNIKNVTFYQGSWCSALPQDIKVDVIVSNPPYLAADDCHLIDTEISYEPLTALVADDRGLADYEAIIKQARHHLKGGGSLFFEHGAEQAESIAALLLESNYNAITCYEDLAKLPRVTKAQL